MQDVIVVGGGVVGLSIARKLAERASVRVLEQGETGGGTSWAAAGMLSPQSEADEAGPFFELCNASLRMFPEWIDELRRESDTDLLYSDKGLLFLAHSDEELAVLRRRAAWQSAAGLAAEMLTAPEVRRREPLITAPVQGALFLPNELSVAPRRLLAALRASCLARGVNIESGVRVTSLSDIQQNAVIVLASGVWSREVAGPGPEAAVYPRKGQILSLKMPPGAFSHMIRWKHSYFVPRPDGELVVGATNEDAGFDRTLTPAGIGSLLADAQAISTHTASWPIQETWSGLRPATPDELPILGEASPGIFYATGHYRNGILLAPITAAIVDALIAGQKPPVPLDAYSPARFAV